jgi:hypothetical protein
VDDNIKMELKDIDSEDMNRIRSVQDRVQWCALSVIVMNTCVLE